MSRKLFSSMLTVLVAMILLLGPAAVNARQGHISKPAAKVNTRWEHKADRNHDGYVGPHEADKAKKDFIKNRAEVDTAWEHKADRNHDGYVGPHEADKAKKDFMSEHVDDE